MNRKDSWRIAQISGKIYSPCNTAFIPKYKHSKISAGAQKLHLKYRFGRERGSVEEITVLCVDDDLRLLMIYQMVLEASGYRVLTASNGPEALERFASCDADAVLLDYSMPNMDGGQVAALMKAMKPHIPVVMLSALPSQPDNAQWVDAFVTKGQSPETWLVRLAELLKRRQSAEFSRGMSAYRFPAAA